MSYFDQLMADEAGESSPPLLHDPKAPPKPALPLIAPDQADSNRLSLSVEMGAKQDPGRAARILKLQAETGLPRELLETNLEEIEQSAATSAFDAESFRQASPIVAQWLAEHPTHAAIAQDDLTTLQRIERLGSSLKRGYRLGVLQTNQALLGYEAKIRGGQIPEGLQQRLDALDREIRGTPEGVTWWEDWIQANAKMVGQQVELFKQAVPSMAAGMTAGAVAGMAGGPLAPLTSAGGAVAGLGVGTTAGYADAAWRLASGEAYLRASALRDIEGNPLPEDLKQSVSTFVGLANAGLEYAGQVIIAAPFKAAFRTWIGRDLGTLATQSALRESVLAFGKSYGLVVAGETTEEVLQEAVSTLGEEIGKAASDRTFDTSMEDPQFREAFYERLLLTATETIKGTTLFAIPGAATHGVSVGLRARIDRAQLAAQTLTDLGQAISESQMAGRAPDRVETLVQRIAEDGDHDGHVYVPVEAWDTYYQAQREDPRQKAWELLGNSQAYDEAKQSGHDLPVPTGTYAVKVAPTTAHQAFVNELRASPQEMNAREAQEALQAEAVRQSEPQRPPAPADTIQSTIAEQLARTGVYTPDAARTMAAPMAEFFRVQAERMGQDPLALWRRYPLRIRGPLEEVSAQPGQTVLTQPGAEAPRGQIRFGGRDFDLTLFASADLSTFLHESGHFYAEVLRDLAASEGASEQLRQDWGTIKNWLGVDGDVLSVEAQEQFARGLEAYFLEGRSPSTALRAAFARFRAWLLALYRSVRALQVTITPDLRRVLDRLFATDTEIVAAERDLAAAPLFATAEAAGMSATEFAAYRDIAQEASQAARERMTAQLVEIWQREHTRWWRDHRQTVLAEVTDEVNARPGYRALSILQRGVLPDGSPLPEGLPPIKLDTASLKAAYSKEQIAQLPVGVHVREGGVTPEAAAAVFGFASGDELVLELMTQPPRQAVIEQETARRMEIRYGDRRLNPDALRVAAQEAVANEGREELLYAELRALRRKQREVGAFVRAARQESAQRVAAGRQRLALVPSLTAVRQWARALMAGQRVKRITPGLYLSTLQRESAAAIRAAAAQRYEDAATHKERELYNLALFREASAARRRIDAMVSALRSFRKLSVRERIGKAGADYLAQIDGLLDRFDLAPISQRELARREDLQSWIMRQREEDLPVDLPDVVLNEAFRTSYLNLTYEELVGLHDGVQQIAHLAALKNRLLKVQAARTVTEAAELAAATIRERTRRAPPSPGARLSREELTRTVGAFFASNRKLSSLLREMDGGQDGGPLWSLIMRPLNEAAHTESEQVFEAFKTFRALFRGLDMAGMYRRTVVPGTTLSLTKMERLMVALNWGNEQNRQRLLSDPKRRWTLEQVGAILETLSLEDWRFVQGVWDALETYWPRIAALAERVDGLPPDKAFRGGYFPLRYDERLSPRIAGLSLEDELKQAMRGARFRRTTKHGHREARLENVRLPVRLDFGVITEHLQQVIHDVSHYETLLDVNRILRHPDVQEAIVDTYGDVVFSQIRTAIDDIALGYRPAHTAIERGFTWMRNGVTIAYLGYNVGTAVLQPLGLTSSMVRIGPKWVAKGLSKWLGSAQRMEGSLAWIHERSELMRTRARTFNRDLHDAYRASSLTGKWSVVQDSFFWLISRAQILADVPTWLGAYEKAMAEGVPESTAIARADQAVEDAQGAGQIKDLPQLMRGGPAIRLWTNFLTYFNTVWNLSAESVRRTEFRNPASVGRLAADLLLLYTIPTLITTWLRAMLRGDELDDEDWFERIVRDQLAAPFAVLPLFRDVTGAIQGYGGFEGPVGSRLFVELGHLVKQLEQEELDEQLFEALNRTAGILFHYPAMQVERTVNGYLALQEGETDNPLALLVGPPRRE